MEQQKKIQTVEDSLRYISWHVKELKDGLLAGVLACTEELKQIRSLLDLRRKADHAPF
jgi:hypothetical protein